MLLVHHQKPPTRNLSNPPGASVTSDSDEPTTLAQESAEKVNADFPPDGRLERRGGGLGGAVRAESVKVMTPG